MADKARQDHLPYGRQLIETDDIAAARAALDDSLLKTGRIDADAMAAAMAVFDGDLLTQGPRVGAFEDAFALRVGAAHAVACSSGTAALQLALTALNVGPSDICVAPAITFLSTATAARLCGAEVVFADVDPATGLMTDRTLEEAAARAGAPVKAVLPVHLGGRQCAMPALADVAARLNAVLVEDACHALGSGSAASGQAGEGRWSQATAFSFHPVKTIACGEGGMVCAADPDVAARIQRLRNHGVTREAGLMRDAELSLGADSLPNPWSYEQLELGFNYRMTEIEAALGLSQLGKLDRFVGHRRKLAALYDQLLRLTPLVERAPAAADEYVAPHLYAIQIAFDRLAGGRAALMRRLAARGIGTQVHYIPVYRQPYFVRRYGAQRLPGAEAYYARTLSLPLFAAMDETDVERVALELTSAINAAGRGREQR